MAPLAVLGFGLYTLLGDLVTVMVSRHHTRQFLPLILVGAVVIALQSVLGWSAMIELTLGYLLGLLSTLVLLRRIDRN